MFDEYGHRQNKITLSGDMKEWSWFKIYLFSKDKIDLVEELNFSNFLLAHHGLFGYEEFSACIDNSLLPEKPLVFLSRKKKITKKMTLNLLVNFWTSVDENKSMTWTISEDSISLVYYFNNENIDFEKILQLLNSSALAYNLQQFGWKFPFRMRVSESETRNRDYFKRIKFVVNK